MLPLLLFLAFTEAGTPMRGGVRCEAIFQGPVDDCAIPGTWTTTGTGLSERRARANAVERLTQVVEAQAQMRLVRAEGTSAGVRASHMRATCGPTAQKQAKVYCYAEPRLTTDAMCFASLEDSRCWANGPVRVEGRMWRGMEQAREELCRQMDLNLAAKGSPDQERLTCRVKCLQDSQVSCLD